MARAIQDSKLDTKAARLRLKPRGKPYYRILDQGCHLGYRKPRGRKGRPSISGAWVLRRYVGGQTYIVETIALADDLSDADGVRILNFTDAQNLARERCKSAAHEEAGAGPYTVRDAVADYVQYLVHQGKKTYEAEKRANAFILPALGDTECAKLTSKELRAWMSKMASTPARVRSKKGKQRYAELDESDDEASRKRRASANRIWTIFRAALNHGFNEKRIASDIEWKRVKAFKGVDNTSIRFLDEAEAQRLIRRADDEFRPMIAAALASGCRYGELCALKVAHFSADNKTLTIAKSKSGKARTIYLNDEGAQLFKSLAAGRLGNVPLIQRPDGLPWDKSHQTRRMQEACAAAKIEPEITFNVLRHSYATLLVKAGVPMKYVSESLGHANTQMTEKHYAGVLKSHLSEQIRANAPKLGLPKSKVTALG
jgi:integrase